jgi:hypothetical protein
VQERGPDSLGTGSIGASVSTVIKTKQNGLVHGNGPHLIKEPLETNGPKQGAMGIAGDQPPLGLNHKDVKKERIVILH